MKTAELNIGAVIAQCDAAQSSLDEGKLVQANGTLRTAIDILTKYILKIRLNVQDDLDLYSRIEYLRSNGIITASEDSLLEAVRKAGNNALHSGVNNDEAFDIQARIKGVRELAAKAPLLTEKDAQGDPLCFDQELSEKVLGNSDLGMTYRSLVTALRHHDSRGIYVHTKNLIGEILGVFYDCTLTYDDLSDWAIIEFKIASIRESLLSVDDRSAMELCWKCINNRISDVQLETAATELVRRFPHLIRKALKKQRQHQSVLYRIARIIAPVVQWVLGLVMIIAVPCAILFIIICIVDYQVAILGWNITLLSAGIFCMLIFGNLALLYYVPWPMETCLVPHPYWNKSMFQKDWLLGLMAQGKYFGPTR